MLALLLIASVLRFTRAQWSTVDNFESKGFVRVQRERFVDGLCQDFLFSGWNGYEVLEATTGRGSYSLPGSTSGTAYLESMFGQAQRAHLTVLRFFGHGVNSNVLAVRESPDQYSEAALRGLDQIIATAERFNIRVIISLLNNWDISDRGLTEADNKSKYASWSPTITEDDDFYTDPHTRRLYLDLLRTMTSRVNTFTGRQYRTDPTILAWNLLNEPRCSCDLAADPSSYSCSVECAQDLNEWIWDMSAAMKEMDPYHMITVGEEGFWGFNTTARLYQANPDWYPGQPPEPWAQSAGQNFTQNHATHAIDFAAMHTWLPDWGRPGDLAFYQNWVNTHISEAKFSLRKPIVHEEFGHTSSAEEPDELIRLPIFEWSYERQLKEAEESGALLGSMFWLWDALDTINDDPYVVKNTDPSFAFAVASGSESLASLLNERPLISDCFPMEEGLYSLQLAFPYTAPADYYFSSGEKLLSKDEGKDVVMPDGTLGARNVTPHDCATLCNQSPDCASFSYNYWNYGGECYLKTGTNQDVAFSNGGWQSFWKVPGTLTTACNIADCGVCLADNPGICVRCTDGYLFTRDRACAPCSSHPPALQQKRSECSAAQAALNLSRRFTGVESAQLPEVAMQDTAQAQDGYSAADDIATSG